MKVKTIEVRVSEKLNVGNYETVDPSVTLTGEIEDGDDLETAYAELSSMAEDLWFKQARTRVRSVISRRVKPEDVEELKDLYRTLKR